MYACPAYFRIFLLGFLLSPLFAQNPIETLETPSHYPYGWQLQKTISVPPHQLQAFGQNLGGKILALKNYFLQPTPGLSVQINVIQCADLVESKKVYAKMLSIRKDPRYVQQQKQFVLEFVGNNQLVIDKVKHFLGTHSKETVLWSVEMQVAPLEKVKDDMQWNPFFNVLWKSQEEGQKRKEWDRLKSYFQFGSNLLLRTTSQSWGKPQYQFSITPDRQEEQNDSTLFHFSSLPSKWEVPQLKIEAKIPVQNFGILAESRKDLNFLLQPTPYWPTKSKEIQEILENLDISGLNEEQRLERIASFVYGKIRYSGNQMGSRYGVKKVLEQGYGHCWDKSDLLITLCRANGLPARQVGGWLMGVSGHIWAEVFIFNPTSASTSGKGWVGVDPTTPWIGVSASYIPFFISEEGQIPLIYWGIPKIQTQK